MADTITVPVLGADGAEVDTITVDPADWGGRVNKQLLHDAVVMYQANKRVGTASVKSRGQVSGSSKKLYRQKGTGNARAGSKRTNVRVGGGVVHGPQPRDYSYSMPKQARRLATRMALLSKFIDNEAVVVDKLHFDAPRTKDMAKLLGAVGIDGQTCLVATGGDVNAYLSGRNLKGVDVMPVGELNALALLKRKRLVISREAFIWMRDNNKAAGRTALVVGGGVKADNEGEASGIRAGAVAAVAGGVAAAGMAAAVAAALLTGRKKKRPDSAAGIEEGADADPNEGGA